MLIIEIFKCYAECHYAEFRGALSGAPLRKAPALLANFILCWKGMQGTNALAYLASALVKK
jgi:hypothetical protein